MNRKPHSSRLPKDTNSIVFRTRIIRSDWPSWRESAIHTRMKRLLSLALLLLALSLQAEDYAANIASLIDPSKLSTLRERGANPRIQKCVYWLAEAGRAGQKPKNVAHEAVSQAGYKSSAATLTEQSLLRNLDIATKLGCLDAEGRAQMRRGDAPTVRKGPYTGEIASVDHIIPLAVVPELDCVIANLELLPLKLNESKNAKISSRQKSLAKKLNKAGLLSAEGLKAVEKSR
jgi:hypothetical protein